MVIYPCFTHAPMTKVLVLFKRMLKYQKWWFTHVSIMLKWPIFWCCSFGMLKYQKWLLTHVSLMVWWPIPWCCLIEYLSTRSGDSPMFNPCFNGQYFGVIHPCFTRASMTNVLVLFNRMLKYQKWLFTHVSLILQWPILWCYWIEYQSTRSERVRVCTISG